MANLQGRTLSLTPYGTGSNNGRIIWRCGNAQASSEMQKPLFTEDGQEVHFVASTIADTYLPANCR